jgi:cytoskeletal protein CcmA (bactofilin family)
MFKNKQENMAAQDASNSSNIIGKGTVVEGNIETFGNIRIEGKVNGSVKSKSKIALGQSSYVEGNIVAQNAEISGEVKGVVEVSDQLILRPSAVIDGDIITNKLIVESGATFNGGCKMGVAPKDIKISPNGQTKPIIEEKKPTTPESKPN